MVQFSAVALVVYRTLRWTLAWYVSQRATSWSIPNLAWYLCIHEAVTLLKYHFRDPGHQIHTYLSAHVADTVSHLLWKKSDNFFHAECVYADRSQVSFHPIHDMRNQLSGNHT